MEFVLTDDQKLIQEAARDFARNELGSESVREFDEKEEYPLGLIRKLAGLGWLGLPFPEEYGGAGGNVLDLAIFLEGIGYGMVALAAAYLQTVIFGGMSLYEYGSEEQKKEYLPPLIRGEKLWCLAATEPNAGSDLASLVTSATPDGNGFFTINGTKTFITGAHVADHFLLAARTNRDVPKHKGITMFIVDSRSPGVEVRRLHKLGMRPVGTNEVFLENVRVPEGNVAGGLNQGWANLLKTLDNERCAVAAMCVGASQRVVDDALEYAKNRVQFGQPISKFQVIQHALANMQIKVDTARLLTYRAAWMAKEGLPCSKETAMAKVHASETMADVADQGLRILGGYGYMMEYDMQRYFRDAKFFQIAGGTPEIQRNVIAKQMGV